METIWRDLRYAARTLHRSPGFTFVAIAALALGIGANTAIFSVVNAVLLESLPYPEPDRLVMVWEKRAREGIDDNSVSPLDFLDWQARNTVFTGVEAYLRTVRDLSGRGEPERLTAGLVSTGIFEVLGAAPEHGRSFRREEGEPGRNRVVILSHGLFTRRFGADPGIIGQTITLSGEPYEVIGVMPASFRFPLGEIDIWQPLVFAIPNMQTRVSHFLLVFARLKPGVSLEMARVEMERLGAQIEQEHPQENRGHSANVVALQEQLVGDLRKALLILLSAVALVLLVACANVANLGLARAAARRREVAVRSALGAGRLRIAQQFLTESMMLSVAGGAAGLMLGWWGIELLGMVIPPEIIQLSEIEPDLRVLGFTLALSLLTGLIFGIAPALQASKSNLGEALKEGERGAEGIARNRLRSLLVVTEVALAIVLLAGAGLMLRSFLKLTDVDPGFVPQNALTLSVSLPGARYREETKIRDFYSRLLDRVRALPGIEAAGAVSILPLSGDDSRTGVGIEGREPNPDEPTRSHIRIATPDYFQAMRIPLIYGRTFDERDAEGTPLVAVISRAMAERYWPGESALGKRFRLGGTEEWREVVGVVGDVRHWGLNNRLNPMMYLPHRQMPSSVMTLVVRTGADPAAFSSAIRAELRALDADLPLARVAPLDEIIAGSVTSPRFYTLLLGIFAAIAVILAAAGIYSVMAYSVAQRTHEIGIRRALGAGERDILRLVMGQGLALTSAGIGLGLVAAFALTRLIESLLYGTSARDPLTFALVVGLLTAVALAACYLPARRAMKVDPMIALRYE